MDDFYFAHLYSVQLCSNTTILGTCKLAYLGEAAWEWTRSCWCLGAVPTPKTVGVGLN